MSIIIGIKTAAIFISLFLLSAFFVAHFSSAFSAFFFFQCFYVFVLLLNFTLFDSFYSFWFTFILYFFFVCGKIFFCIIAVAVFVLFYQHYFCLFVLFCCCFKKIYRCWRIQQKFCLYLFTLTIVLFLHWIVCSVYSISVCLFFWADFHDY